MKKVLLFVSLLMTLNLLAHFPIRVDTKESRGLVSNVDFALLQIGVAPFEAQLYDGQIPTFISVNLLLLMQKSAAVSLAVINGTGDNYFLQCGALFSITDNNYFISAAPFNMADNNYGLQLGIGNISSYGIQAGIVNIGVVDPPAAQIGVCNKEGIFQLGIYNSHGKVQLGLLNYNPDAWIKWMPFFNFSCGTETADADHPESIGISGDPGVVMVREK